MIRPSAYLALLGALLAVHASPRTITVHRPFIVPGDAILESIRGARGARVFRLAFYEPGCPGDEAWAAKTVGCYSVRRELPAPSDAWRAAVVHLLADTRTYSTQFERECAGSPEYVVRLETGREPLDAWICLECTQITLTLGSKMTARGGFDRVAKRMRTLLNEAAAGEDRDQLPDWALARDDFPLEAETLPVDEPPGLEGVSSGIRILTRGSKLAPGERRVRVRIGPEGSRVFARVEAGITPEELHRLEPLVRGLVFTPARRNGLPVSSWAEIAYLAPR